MRFVAVTAGPDASRRAKSREAAKLGRRLGLDPEEVTRRWRSGLVWCGVHGWEQGRCTPGERRATAKAAGRCARCFAQPAKEGRSLCDECLGDDNERQSRHRRALGALHQAVRDLAGDQSLTAEQALEWLRELAHRRVA